MAGTTATVTVDDQQAIAAVRRLQTGSSRSLLASIGEYLMRSTKERFNTQAAPDGTPWKPLKPGYAKRKKYNSDKILTLRGYLRRGIRYQRSGDDTAEVGTNDKRAAIHQFGGTIQKPQRHVRLRMRAKSGRLLFASRKHKRVIERDAVIPAHQVNMPARPFVGVSAGDQREITSIVNDWLLSRIRG